MTEAKPLDDRNPFKLFVTKSRRLNSTMPSKNGLTTVTSNLDMSKCGAETSCTSTVAVRTPAKIYARIFCSYHTIHQWEVIQEK